MARNRKSQSAAIRFGPAVKAFLLCLLIGGSGVGYVWQQDQISRLGQQIATREKTLRLLGERNEKLRKQLAIQRSPRLLEARASDFGLAPPQPAQVWRLIEPSVDLSGSARERQFAAKTP